MHLYVPSKFASGEQVELDPFLNDLNGLISTRGFVTFEGQLLTEALSPGTVLDVTWERFDPDSPLAVPPARPWGAEQQEYFGLERPY